ncbi:hypothetical protein [Enterovirga rhinocerotis]|uniref:Peptidoglycan-binding protein CsiV n=1 Tax=Enterovirga rhinocerotis TaxID=1339210 RepID=A0A4R7BJT7_9HYPH|nr:hypothetical protein [Enterovirga rhinocerotis]TDR85461.1 hypothetical protein EV668_4583 [Enterovirga rhinocerotis]
MTLLRAAALAALLLGAPAAEAAPDAALEEARSISDLGLPSAPNVIRFSDREGKADGPSLTPFARWATEYPDQKRLLSLHPDYVEPTVSATVDGLRRTRDEKLDIYVAASRMIVDRPPSRVDLAGLASAAALAKIDPAIRHRPITAGQAIPNRDPEQPYNRLPGRAWCEGGQVSCFESRYDLEGKLPLGIRLANKLEDGGKKIADHVTFQSEIRLLAPAEIDAGAISRLTGIETQPSAVLEQSTFHVNQILRFGKLLTIVQPAPSQPDRSVVSVYFALGVKADVLSRKKEYERIPVLRNLVPSQVLMGTSSFNTGTSLSAGLPVYARSRIRTLASLLASGR